jgi:hypothetical protein
MAGQTIGPNGNATNLLPVGRRVGGSLLSFRGFPGAKSQ